MPLSRREFVTQGALAGALAGAEWQSPLFAAAQKILPPQDEHVEDAGTKSAFAAAVTSTFRVNAPYGLSTFTLVAVNDLLANAKAEAGRESYALIFEGDSASALQEDIYTFEHAALGSFPLFVSPATADAFGRQRYVAIVNRLPNSPPLLGSPVRQRRGLKR